MRRSALALADPRLAGVLVLGVLQGLIVAAGLSLVYVVFRLSRPAVGALGRDPRSGAWGWLERHPDWTAPPGTLVIRSDGPLFYPNVRRARARASKRLRSVRARSSSTSRILRSRRPVGRRDRRSRPQLRAQGVELRLAAVRAQAAEILERAGVTERVRVDATLDAAVAP